MLERQADPAASVALFEKCSQVASGCRALKCERLTRAVACELIDLRGRRTEEKKPYGMLAESASGLGHADRIRIDQRHRGSLYVGMSRNFWGGPDRSAQANTTTRSATTAASSDRLIYEFFKI